MEPCPPVIAPVTRLRNEFVVSVKYSNESESTFLSDIDFVRPRHFRRAIKIASGIEKRTKQEAYVTQQWSARALKSCLRKSGVETNNKLVVLEFMKRELQHRHENVLSGGFCALP